MTFLRYMICVFCVFSTNALATEAAQKSLVRPSSQCQGREVVAAWYQSGQKTASGERFDPNGNTAAMRHPVPLGSSVKVTNPRTGQSIVVRINDRGPFVRGITIDLARGAATRIGMTSTQRVCLDAL
jgi:rare lipoprotein A